MYVFILCASLWAAVVIAQPARAGARIVLRALDAVTLQIEHTGWGETLIYSVPEYAFPTVNRGRIAASDPVIDPLHVTFSGMAEVPRPGSYAFRFETHDDYLDVTATVVNLGHDAWNAATTCVLCLRFTDTATLNDSTRTDTYVTRSERLIAIAEIPSRPHHAAHALDSTYLDEIDSRTVRKYFRHGEVTNSLIVRSSSDGRRHVAIAWGDARNVSYNFRRDYRCIHSEPRFAGVEPNEERVVRGRIYLFDGTRDELVARFNADFPEQAIDNDSAPPVGR